MSNMKRRDPFQAIADPTRRAIIGLLANETMNLNSVAEKFNVSRPAISKHIKILTQCGLIEIRQKGRERFCEARLESLNLVEDWMKDYKRFWDTTMEVAAKPAEKTAAIAVQVEEPEIVTEEMIVEMTPFEKAPEEGTASVEKFADEVSTVGMPEEEIPFDDHEYQQFVQSVSGIVPPVAEAIQEESASEVQEVAIPEEVIQTEEVLVVIENKEVVIEEPVATAPAFVEDAQISQSIKHVIERKQVDRKPKEKRVVQEAPTLQISLF